MISVHGGFGAGVESGHYTLAAQRWSTIVLKNTSKEHKIRMNIPFLMPSKEQPPVRRNRRLPRSYSAAAVSGCGASVSTSWRV